MADAARRLTMSQKAWWAIGELPVATYVGLTIGFLLFYCTQALGISPWLAGLVLLAPRIWDAVTDPFMGAISDRTRSRMGRRRPYLLTGSILLAVSVFVLFMAPEGGSEFAKALYVLVAFTAASTAITVYDVPYSSMAAEMSDDYRERTSLIGYKMIGARAGILLVLFGAPALLALKPTLPEGFRLVGAAFSALAVIAGLAAVRFTAAAPRIERRPQPFDLRRELDAVLSNRPFRLLWLVFFFQNLAIGVGATLSLYLLTIVMTVDRALLPFLMATPAIAAMVATPLWVRIGRKVGKHRAYRFALIAAAFLVLPILIVPPGAFTTLAVALLAIGIGDAGNQLMPNAMVPDTVEVDEQRTGERREGALFGAWAFCRKLGMTAGAFIASLLLGLIGFEAGAATQSAEAVAGVRLIYVLIPCALWLVAFFLVHRYALDEETFNAVKSDIQGRGAAPAASLGPAHADALKPTVSEGT